MLRSPLPHAAEALEEAVMADTMVSFRHRQNGNLTYDSICLQCFRTIATEKKKEELPELEKNHDCKGFDLERLFYSK
jgi:hypothetical protein